jgi:hypothetical protein
MSGFIAGCPTPSEHKYIEFRQPCHHIQIMLHLNYIVVVVQVQSVNIGIHLSLE